MARLDVYEDRAEIHRGSMGRLATGGPSKKTFIYSRLSAVEFKKASLTNGYIQFVGSGLKAKSGSFNAANNENTIMFSRNSKIWQETVDFMNTKIAEGSKSTVIQELSVADEILKFKELADKGIITPEEFNAKKKQLMGL